MDRTFPWWTTAPALLLVTALTIYPTLLLLLNALYSPEAGWLAGPHVAEMGRDPILRPAIRNTVVFTVVVVAAETVLGFALAVAAARIRRGAGFYRTVLLMPLLLPGVVIGTMWRLMFDFNTGIIPQVLNAVGIEGVTWLADPDLALPSVMIVEVWHSTSFLFLLFLAGIANIPRELVEAAEVDGASSWQIVRSILIPVLRPVILIAVILRLIDAFKVFDVLVVLTNGGPGTSTQMLNFHVFRLFFNEFRFSYASFVGVLLALLIGLAVALYAALLRTRSRGVA